METPLEVYTRYEVWRELNSHDYVVIQTDWVEKPGWFANPESMISMIENIHSVYIVSTTQAHPLPYQKKEILFRLDQANSREFYSFLLSNARRIK
jgi:hypothetical protein